MRPGTILRGTSYNTVSSEETKNIAIEKLESITEEAKSTLNEKIEEYKDMFHEKLCSLDDYKSEIEAEFNEKFNKQELLFTDILNNMDKEYQALVSRMEESMTNYLSEAKNDIKDITLILFEKFFFTQYQDMDNLESLIQDSLLKLEDSNNIQISLSNKYYNKFKEEKQNLFNKLKENNINLTSHLKESLVCEIKSDEGSIEIDFEKQMEKIKEVITEF